MIAVLINVEGVESVCLSVDLTFSIKRKNVNHHYLETLGKLFWAFLRINSIIYRIS